MDFSQYVNLGLTPESQEFYRKLSEERVPSGTETGANAPLPLKQRQEALRQLQVPEQSTSPSWHTAGRIMPTKSNFWYAIPYNAVRNAGDISTGLTYSFTHIPELAERFVDFQKRNWKNTEREAKVFKKMVEDGNATIGDYAQYLGRVAQTNPVNATVNKMADLWGQPYNLDTNTLGNIVGVYKDKGFKEGTKAVVQQGKNTLKSMAENPLDVALDFAPVISTGAKAANKAIGKTGKGFSTAKGATAGQVAEDIINTSTSEVARDTNKIVEQAKDLGKNKNLSDLIKRAEETGDWEGVPVAQREALKKFSDDYNIIAQKHSPQTAVDPEHLTVAQNISRRNGITYREAEKQIQALNDSIPNTPVTVQRSLEDLSDIGKTNTIVNNLRKEANLPEVVAPKVQYNSEVKTLVKNVPEDAIISKEATFAGQSKKVQDALGKVAPELINPNKTGLDIYNDLVVKTGSPQAASDVLRKAGVGGIRGVEDGVTTVFGGKAKGGYNRANDSINFFKDADETTRAHELFHRSLEQTKDVPKIKEALKSALGDGYKLTDDVLENLTDGFVDYIKTGKAPSEGLKNLYDIYTKEVRKGDKLEGLKALANQGDNLAQQVVEATEKYRKGDLFPITHAMDEAAEIDKSLKAASELNDAQRIYSGKFSTREFGTQTYEDIARALSKPDEYVERLSKQYIGNNIARQLEQGVLAGESVLAKSEKEAKYVSREALQSGDILKALDNATDKAVRANDIPINKYVVGELKRQLKPFGSPFGYQLLNDVYNLGKGQMLASGTYLGANAIGGSITSLLASGTNILDDVANAIATRGRLSKELGTYRGVSQLRNIKTPVLRQLNQFNKYTTGGVTEFIDRKLQNAFSEIAANRKLRQMGVLPQERLKYIEAAEADKLADIIRDVKATSLLNNSKTFFPRWAIEPLAMSNPFWRWVDTAAASTVHMTTKYPLLSNWVLNQTLAQIGFDKEMQNRLNLGVKSDKQGVTYYFDERTGQTKEATIEWIPQMNTFKLISNPKDSVLRDPTTSVTLARLWNAANGKDVYGRALKRAEKNPNRRLTHIYDGAQRLVLTDHGWEEQGGRLDELASTFAKETIGILNLANKNVLPMVGTSLGLKYYQPYAQSLFGDFHKDEISNNMIMGGDPRKPREAADVLGSYLGLYSQPYIPALQEGRPLSVRKGRSLLRKQRYDLLRKERGY